MLLRFHGPCGRVTGSCYQLVDEGRNRQILIDCGLLQDEPGAQIWNEGPFPFDPAKINFVLLTHAHIDHCGLLPKLYREGFNGEVWCTCETAQIALLSLKNAAENDQMAYGVADVERIRWREPPGLAPLATTFKLGPDLYARFARTGHLPGAVAITVLWGPPGCQRSIVFSGDLGPVRLPLHGNLLANRGFVDAADYAVCESTYGNTLRSPDDAEMSSRLLALADAIDPSLEMGGTVLLPVFAIGRAQDVLFDLSVLFALFPHKYSSVDVVLHSQLASDVAKEYATALGATQKSQHGQTYPLWRSPFIAGELLGLEDSPKNSKFVAELIRAILLGQPRPMPPAGENLKPFLANFRAIHRVVSGSAAPYRPNGRPRIVLAAAGMCTGGAIVHYLANQLEDPRCTVAFTGYQSPSTLGGQIAALGRDEAATRQARPGTIELVWNEKHKRIGYAVAEADVMARIVQLTGYSGHADQADLVRWLAPEVDGVPKPLAPVAFLTHGSDAARAGLADRLMREVGAAIHVESPRADERWYDLDVGEWLERAPEANEAGLRMLLRSRNEELAKQSKLLRRYRPAA